MMGRVAFALLSMTLAGGANAASYGPRVPVGPQASIACPSGSIAVTPATVALIGTYPAGTSYCLAAGVYNGLSISPQNGDTYTGQVGAILDGGGTVAKAFSGGASPVMIRNLVVRNYAPGLQHGMIDNRDDNGDHWSISNVEATGANGVGIAVQNSSFVSASNMHDNTQEGYTCAGTSVAFTDNVIANNNPTDAVDQGWEAGGGKCWQSTGASFTYNRVTGNHGPGLWFDDDNQGVLVEYNDIEGNLNSGIYQEISWDATIAFNKVQGNGGARYCPGWLWCSQIQIAASGGVNGKVIDIHDNVVGTAGAANANLIGLIQQNRGSGLFGAWLVQNVHVHNNTVDLSGGGMGAVQDLGDNSIFTARGNSFDYDALSNAGAASFFWNNTQGDLPFFKSFGQEIHPPGPPVTAPPSGSLTITVPPCPTGYTARGKLCEIVNP